MEIQKLESSTDADNGHQLYRGLIMKYNEKQHSTKVAFAFLDLISASGGLITGLYYALIPLAGVFSRLRFEVGLISLLFLARTNASKHNERFRKLSKLGSSDNLIFKGSTLETERELKTEEDNNNPDAEGGKDHAQETKKPFGLLNDKSDSDIVKNFLYERNVKLSTPQFLRLFCAVYNPCREKNEDEENVDKEGEIAAESKEGGEKEISMSSFSQFSAKNISGDGQV